MNAIIRDQADIRAVEKAGLDRLLLAPSPIAILRRAARLWPEACAIRYVPGEGAPAAQVSFAELLGQVERAASLFRRLGASDGPVAIFMPHTVNTQIALWGAELAGRACPINPMLQPDHIVALLRAARARVAVALGRNRELDVWDRVHDAIRAAGCVAAVFDADADEPSPGSDGRLEDLVAREQAVPIPDPDPDSVASLFPTGGTTAAPKLTPACAPQRSLCLERRQVDVRPPAWRGGAEQLPAVPCRGRLRVRSVGHLRRRDAACAGAARHAQPRFRRQHVAPGGTLSHDSDGRRSDHDQHPPLVAR